MEMPKLWQFVGVQKEQEISRIRKIFLFYYLFLVIFSVPVLLNVIAFWLWPEKWKLFGFLDFHSLVSGLLGAVGALAIIYPALYFFIGCKMSEVPDVKGGSNG